MSQTSTAAPCVCGHAFELHDGVGCSAFIGGYPETTHIRRYCNCPGYTVRDTNGGESPDDESAA